jgi:hypothetical protein
MRILLASIALAVVFVACGGKQTTDPTGHNAQERTAKSAGDSKDLEVGELLRRSLQRTLEMKTFEMDSQVESASGGDSVRVHTDMWFREPRDIYATLQILGLDVEVLVLPPDLFVRKHDAEWQAVDKKRAPSVERLLNEGGVSQFKDLIEGLVDVSLLPDEEINGAPSRHVSGKFDLVNYLSTLPPGAVDPSDLNDAKTIGSPELDLWLDSATLLFRRMNMRIEFEVDGEPADLTFTADFEGWDKAGNFPDRPVNALPFESF